LRRPTGPKGPNGFVAIQVLGDDHTTLLSGIEGCDLCIRLTFAPN
jgi:hypothetical protein